LIVHGRPRVVAVGLGPSGPALTTPAASEALASASWVVLRTRRHPAAEGLRYPSFDDLYERASSFEELYEEIVDAVAAAALEHGDVAYGVPGSPLVLERTVELLRTRPEVELEVVPAMSFCDLAWARLGIDPVAAGVRLVDGESFASASAGGGALLVGQCWSRTVLSEIKLASEDDGPQTATILYHLGLADEQVLEVPWADIDRTVEPDHLTTLYIPALGAPAGSELVKVAETVRVLRERCPWDREQTHQSLVRHLLEETYEAIEAIEALGPDPTAEQAAHLEEELGDLLCQVLFHSILASEEGLFQLSDVAAGLRSKLVSRHPHVFAGASADTAAHVVAGWERGKLAEKGRTSLMEGIPTAMPALALAAKVERKATGANLGWNVTGDDDELQRLLDEVAGTDRGDPGDAADAALGELLFALARRASARGVDPEAALRVAVARFRERFVAVEEAAGVSETSLHDLPPDRRIALWEAAEHRSRR
jgi:tetrapyrrole methylase family protein/MazG family protein